MAKKIQKYKPNEERKRKRPKVRWEDQFMEDTNEQSEQMKAEQSGTEQNNRTSQKVHAVISVMTYYKTEVECTRSGGPKCVAFCTYVCF